MNSHTESPGEETPIGNFDMDLFLF